MRRPGAALPGTRSGESGDRAVSALARAQPVRYAPATAIRLSNQRKFRSRALPCFRSSILGTDEGAILCNICLCENSLSAILRRERRGGGRVVQFACSQLLPPSKVL